MQVSGTWVGPETKWLTQDYSTFFITAVSSYDPDEAAFTMTGTGVRTILEILGAR